MALNKELKHQKEVIDKRIPKFISHYMHALTNKLKSNGMEAKPLNVGDTLPDSTLKNHKNKSITLYSLTNNKPAIISFYRGTWCPYCNLELRAYDRLLKELPANTYQMLAISPEQPDKTISSLGVDALSFTVLSDPSNHYATKIGLVFRTPLLLRILYSFDGISLRKSQGNTKGELPIPATYIINGEHIITRAWVDADYTKRAEPQDVIDSISNL